MGKSLAASADRYGPVGADLQDNPNCLYDPCIPSVSDRLACLFLLVFVIEGQGLFIRGFFLVMGIIVLADYLKFLKALVRKRRKKASKGYPVK